MMSQQFFKQHKDCDLRTLAFKKMPEGVDATWMLRQIEGYQLAKKKLPRWASTEGLLYPPRLSMEQCSSQQTAEYKAMLLQRLCNNDICNTLIDLTGGFGVDFSYMAQHSRQAIYVEQQSILCEAARHNMPLLNLPHAEIHNTNCIDFLHNSKGYHDTVVFLDPARRDDAGKKVFCIEDCTPNLTTLLPLAITALHPRHIIIKLSPMLDITQALRTIPDVNEVHTISVKGECKEILLVVSPQTSNPLPTSENKEASPSYHCVNLDTNDSHYIYNKVEGGFIPQPILANVTSLINDDDINTQHLLLVEPNASILKAGLQDAMAQDFKLQKIAPDSNLYLLQDTITAPSIPGRVFAIEGISDFSKNNLRSFLKDIKQANLTIRNFPSTVAELRKRLKLKEGGDIYLFATTTRDGKHILIKSRKASHT